MRLIDQLLTLAGLWADANERSLARLGTMVVNDGDFFERISKPGKDCTTKTFEKFLLFLREPANWPDRTLPDSAVSLLDNLANIATGTDPSAGKTEALSPCPATGRAA